MTVSMTSALSNDCVCPGCNGNQYFTRGDEVIRCDLCLESQIDAIAAEIARDGMYEAREAASEVLAACRPVEHVRPVNVDAMGKWLMGRVAA